MNFCMKMINLKISLFTKFNTAKEKLLGAVLLTGVSQKYLIRWKAYTKEIGVLVLFNNG